MIGRGRFRDVVERQLALFERENADLIADCAAAERAYDRADRDDAEERYSEFLDLAATAGEILVALRDGFASTLSADAADEYVSSFDRAVARRFPRFALELDDR